MRDELEFVQFSAGEVRPLTSEPISSPGFIGGGTASKNPALGILGSKWGWVLDEADEDDELGSLQEELEIDPAAIKERVMVIVKPTAPGRIALMESPDFFGPFGIVMGYSAVCFTRWVITLWFFGSFLIFFLTRSLGGEVSFLGTLSVIGYSCLPLVLAGLLGYLLPSILFKAVGVICLGWSTFSASSLLAGNTSENEAEDMLKEKKGLVVYPILLLFVNLFQIQYGA
eukprot:GEMP01035331.1.p1 GENE.GEMP01035331.1~~GEMP01035331.1.p1  ORF type:complete len:228 (-),score=59.05 GEMP01035331.1:1332-2015(-)